MSVYVSQRFESESIRNLPIRARKNFSSFRRRRRAWEKTKKNASLSDFDAKTMRAKESTRTGRVQSTTNDWTFLDPFFAAGAIFMFDFFLSVWWDFARENVLCFWWGREGKLSFFFRFSFFSIVLLSCLFTQSSLLLLWQRRRQRRQRRQRRRWFSTWKDWRCTSRTSTCTRYVLNE